MRISVKVQPRSSQRKIINDEKGIKVFVKSSPTDGKANIEVCEVIAEHYNVRKSAVSIISGSTSRNKIVEIL